MNKQENRGIQLPKFKRKSLDRVTSPEHLTEYLRVTNPSTWVILASAVLLLVGLLVWASIGSLEMKAAVVAQVTDQEAQVVATEEICLQQGWL